MFLNALVIMLVRRLHKVHELLTVLAEPSAEMQAPRKLLTGGGCFSSRRPWERRLQAMPASRPAQMGCLGRDLVALIQPWFAGGRAVAIDSVILLAKGGVWHQKDRKQGIRRAAITD